MEVGLKRAFDCDHSFGHCIVSLGEGAWHDATIHSDRRYFLSGHAARGDLTFWAERCWAIAVTASAKEQECNRKNVDLQRGGHGKKEEKKKEMIKEVVRFYVSCQGAKSIQRYYRNRRVQQPLFRFVQKLHIRKIKELGLGTSSVFA